MNKKRIYFSVYDDDPAWMDVWAVSYEASIYASVTNQRHHIRTCSTEPYGYYISIEVA